MLNSSKETFQLQCVKLSLRINNLFSGLFTICFWTKNWVVVVWKKYSGVTPAHVLMVSCDFSKADYFIVFQHLWCKTTKCGKYFEEVCKTIKFPFRLYIFFHFWIYLLLFLPVSKTSLTIPLPKGSGILEYWQCVETVFDLSFYGSKLSILTSSKLGKSFF